MFFKCLEDQKVEHIFGYPGGAVLPIYDELKNHPSIKHILVRHEQGAGHAAEGYARSTGKPGVVLVTSGPGATNVVTALTDAYMDYILQKPIDAIIDFDPSDCMGIVKTWWHDLEEQYTNTRHIPHTYTDLNSSVLRWNDNFDSTSLYKYFLKHKQQVLWYYRGLDNFFHHRRISKFKMFPLGWVYSFNQGYIFPHDTEKHVYRELPYVCIFDSMGKSEDVKF